MSTSVLGDAVLADMILTDPPTPTAVNTTLPERTYRVPF